MARRGAFKGLDNLGVAGQIKLLFPSWQAQRNEAIRLDRWYKGKNEAPSMPNNTTAEYKELQKASYTPILGLVVTTVAQSLYVDGYRDTGSRADSPSWRTMWQTNGMDAKQIAVHRGALAHGESYVKVLPGEDPITGDKRASFIGVSAKRMAVWWQDEAEDDWPMWALQGDVTPEIDDNGTRTTKIHWQLFDEQNVYYASSDEDGSNIQYINQEPHGSRVVPVRRFANMLDLDGVSTGEVAPFIPIAARIDQDVFDRLVVQRFGSWRVRTIAGMAKPETDEDARAAAIRLRIEDLLISTDKDTRFGTLEPTPMDGYIASFDSDLRTLAAVSQTPPHFLLGAIANLSAEALAAAAASLTAKVAERKAYFGEAWESCFRLGAYLMDDKAGARAFSSQVVWRDTESRSLVQTATALGILAVQLQVPFEMLWEKIPGFTQEDITDAKAILQKNGGINAIYQRLAAQGAGGANQPADAGTTSTDRSTAVAQKA